MLVLLLHCLINPRGSTRFNPGSTDVFLLSFCLFWHFLSFLCHLLSLTSQIGCPPWLAVYPGLVTEAMLTAPLEIHLTFSHVIDFFCSSSKTSVRNLGEVFDSSLNFDSHIKCTSRSFYFHLRNISKMRASFFELGKLFLRWCHCTCCDALLPV